MTRSILEELVSAGIHPLSIGAVILPTPLVLAPMAGITDSAFRRMILSLGGCSLVVTEMIDAGAFSPQALCSHRMLRFHPQEHPIAAQIVGHDPQAVAQAARTAQEQGVDMVDINAGCPSPHVTHRGGGAALLRAPERLEAILGAVRRAIDLPLTLKIRSGWSDRSVVAPEIARLAEACGCDAVTVHARTRAQRYGGPADWGVIRQAVEAVSIPILASGDILSVSQARDCLEQTGCAGLMIARGIRGNPWLIAQIAAALSGDVPHRPTAAEQYAFLARYVELLRQEIPTDRHILRQLRRVVAKMQLQLPQRAAFRRQFMAQGSLEEAWQVIEQAFEPVLDSGSPRTDGGGACSR